MNHRRAAAILAGALFVFLAGAYYFGDDVSDGAVAAAGFLLVAISYAMGLFAIIFGILFSILGALTSLPVISVIYGWLIFTFSTLPYRIFTYLFSKTLARMRWYRTLESKILNSSTYQKLSTAGDRFLKKLGIASPMLLEVFPIKKCGDCNRKIPADSRYCPHCGKRFESK
jgi:hypothetical protein